MLTLTSKQTDRHYQTYYIPASFGSIKIHKTLELSSHAMYKNFMQKISVIILDEIILNKTFITSHEDLMYHFTTDLEIGRTWILCENITGFYGRRRTRRRLKTHGENLQYSFLSPPVLMHGGLLCVAFCLSVCPSVRLSVCLSVCDYSKSH